MPPLELLEDEPVCNAREPLEYIASPDAIDMRELSEDDEDPPDILIDPPTLEALPLNIDIDPPASVEAPIPKKIDPDCVPDPVNTFSEPAFPEREFPEKKLMSPLDPDSVEPELISKDPLSAEFSASEE